MEILFVQMIFPYRRGASKGGSQHPVVIQRDGRGLLEYQAMPSLREVAHAGWLCTFII
jgi:hypothetical protein